MGAFVWVLVVASCRTTAPEAAAPVASRVAPALPTPVLVAPARSDLAWTPAPTRSLGRGWAALAPDGRVYTVDGDAVVESTNGRRTRRWPTGLGELVAVEVSRGGAVVLSHAGVVARLDLRSGVASPIHELGADDRVEAVHAFAPTSTGGVHVAAELVGRCMEPCSTDVDVLVGGGTPEALPLLATGVRGPDGAWLAPGETLDGAEMSADGRWLLTHTREGSTLQGPLTAEDHAVAAPEDGPYALSPAGRWLVTSAGTRLTTWDLRTGAAHRATLDEPPSAVAWSLDGGQVVLVTEHTVQRYTVGEAGPTLVSTRDVREGERVAELHGQEPAEAHLPPITTLAVDGDAVYGGGPSGLFELSSGTARKLAEGAIVAVAAGTLPGDGDGVAYATADTVVLLASTGVELSRVATPLNTLRWTSAGPRGLGPSARVAGVPLVATPGTCARRCAVEWAARAAASGLGVAAPEVAEPAWELVATGARPGDEHRSEPRDASVQVAADGTLAWADDDGRIWAGAPGARAVFVAGPAEHAHVAFVGTTGLDVSRRTGWTRHPLGTAVVPADAEATPSEGVPPWRRSDGGLVAEVDPAGVVRAGVPGKPTGWAFLEWPRPEE